jgi:membrane-bound lytic murein transglycosylase F
VPYGYARGWEPVLYVNNIRSYYNILKWLTANEEPGNPEDLDLPQEESPEPEVVEDEREITET